MVLIFAMFAFGTLAGCETDGGGGPVTDMGSGNDGGGGGGGC